MTLKSHLGLTSQDQLSFRQSDDGTYLEDDQIGAPLNLFLLGQIKL